MLFTTKARDQIEKLLQYVSASGNAALVNRANGEVLVTDGKEDSTGLAKALESLDLRSESIEEMRGVTVCELGASCILVVKEGEPRIDCGMLRTRIEKASQVLKSSINLATRCSAERFMPWMREE